MLKRIYLLIFTCIFLAQPIVAKGLKIIYASEMRDALKSKYGTYTNLQTLLREYRKTNDVVFLFGGNSFGPSLISNMDKGAHIVSILNIMSPDVLAVSQSDFMFSAEELSLRADEANFPFVLSNVLYEDGESIYKLLPRFMIKKAGVKIGVISVLNKRAKQKYGVDGIKVLDIRNSIAENARILRKQGAEIITLITTYYSDVPKELIADGTIDLAFSKHGHSNENRFLIGTRIINLDKKDKVAIVDVKKKGKKYSFKIKEDSLKSYRSYNRIDRFTDAYSTKVNAFLKEKIGITKVGLNTKTDNVRSKENVFANILTDAGRDYAKSDIMFINSGAIWGNKIYRPNTYLTRKDLLQEIPFGDKLVFLEMKGSHILKVFEHGLGDKDNDDGKFLHVSGAKLIYDSSLKAGHRIKSMSINGKPLEKDKIYTVATVDFLYNGGNGYDMIKKNSKRIKKYKLDYVVFSGIVRDYIAKLKVIDKKLENRLRDLSKDGLK